MLADRPRAIAALPKIFLAEIERLLLAVSGFNPAANTPASARPRLGGISFIHRFGSALNRHVHLHACVTDGVFRPAVAEAGCDAPPAFLPARPITQADLAALGVWLVFYQEKCLTPSGQKRPLRAALGTKPPTGSGPATVGSPRGREPTVSSSSRRLSSWTGSPISSRRRGSTGVAITKYSRRTTSCEKPSRRWRSGTLASHGRPRPSGMGATVTAPEAAVTRIRIKSPARTTRHGLRGRNFWPGWGSFRSSARTAAATSG